MGKLTHAQAIKKAEIERLKNKYVNISKSTPINVVDVKAIRKSRLPALPSLEFIRKKQLKYMKLQSSSVVTIPEQCPSVCGGSGIRRRRLWGQQYRSKVVLRSVRLLVDQKRKLLFRRTEECTTVRVGNAYDPSTSENSSAMKRKRRSRLFSNESSDLECPQGIKEENESITDIMPENEDKQERNIFQMMMSMRTNKSPVNEKKKQKTRVEVDKNVEESPKWNDNDGKTSKKQKAVVETDKIAEELLNENKNDLKTLKYVKEIVIIDAAEPEENASEITENDVLLKRTKENKPDIIVQMDKITEGSSEEIKNEQKSLEKTNEHMEQIAIVETDKLKGESPEQMKNGLDMLMKAIGKTDEAKDDIKTTKKRKENEKQKTIIETDKTKEKPFEEMKNDVKLSKKTIGKTRGNKKQDAIVEMDKAIEESPEEIENDLKILKKAMGKIKETKTQNTIVQTVKTKNKTLKKENETDEKKEEPSVDIESDVRISKKTRGKTKDNKKRNASVETDKSEKETSNVNKNDIKTATMKTVGKTSQNLTNDIQTQKNFMSYFGAIDKKVEVTEPSKVKTNRSRLSLKKSPVKPVVAAGSFKNGKNSQKRTTKKKTVRFASHVEEKYIGASQETIEKLSSPDCVIVETQLKLPEGTSRLPLQQKNLFNYFEKSSGDPPTDKQEKDTKDRVETENNEKKNKTRHATKKSSKVKREKLDDSESKATKRHKNNASKKKSTLEAELNVEENVLLTPRTRWKMKVRLMSDENDALKKDEEDAAITTESSIVAKTGRSNVFVVKKNVLRCEVPLHQTKPCILQQHSKTTWHKKLNKAKAANSKYPIYKWFRILSEHTCYNLTTTKKVPDVKHTETPKRKRGRPKKNARLEDSADISSLSDSTDDANAEMKPLIATNADNKAGWTEKYKPMKGEAIVGNKKAMVVLSEWLKYWVENSEEILATKRKRTTSTSSTDFESDDAGNRPSSSAGPDNTVVLVGPNGSGKTSTVYALCAEFGVNVLELNASSKRTGKRLLQDMQEATQSHQVRKADALTNFLHKPESDDSETVPNNGRICLLLVEDVDVVFESHDEGFVTALNTLLYQSKRPVVLVTSDENCSHVEKFMARHLVVRFHTPPPLLSAAWLQVLCFLEGIEVDVTVLSELLEVNRGDLRKTILAVEFWAKTGGDVITRKKRALLQNATSALLENTASVSSVVEEDVDDDETSKMSWLSEGKILSDTTTVSESIVHKDLLDFYAPKNNTIDLDLLWRNVPQLNRTKTLEDSAEVLECLSLGDVWLTDAETKRTPMSFMDKPLRDSLELKETKTEYNSSRELSVDMMSSVLDLCIGKERKIRLGIPTFAERQSILQQHQIDKDLMNAVPLANLTSRKEIFTDYFSALRSINRSEMFRSRISDKRRSNRFYHYLRSLNVPINQRTTTLMNDILHATQ